MDDLNNQMSSVTIKDIAKVTGKSYATVSRALNGKYGVHQKTKETITQVAKQMGYQPNIIARNLVTKRTNTIGIIIPDITNPFFADIVFAVEKFFANKGYTVIITNTNWRKELEKERFELLLRSQVDGIIMKSASDGTLNYYKKNENTPIIILSAGFEVCANASCVDYDDVYGGFVATTHLIEMGYRRIAFIFGNPDAFSSKDRFEGYKNALIKHNIPLKDEYVYGGCFAIETGIEGTNKMLLLPKPPDAVFCSNDIIALGATQAAIEAGLNVPKDFGVVGYDDISYASLPQIQLTSVAQPRFKMGTLAAEMLFSMIEKSDESEPKKVLLKPSIVARKTTCKSGNKKGNSPKI